MTKRMSDEAMKRIAEEGSATAMLLLWQECQRSREREVRLEADIVQLERMIKDLKAQILSTLNDSLPPIP